MTKRFANSTSSHWNADVSDLTLSLPSSFSKVYITEAHLSSSSAHPEVGYEGTLTEYCNDQAVFDEEVESLPCV